MICLEKKSPKPLRIEYRTKPIFVIKVLNIIEEGRGGGPLGRIRIVAKHLSNNILTKVIAPEGATAFLESLKGANVASIPTNLHPLTKASGGLLKYVFSFLKEVRSLTKTIRAEAPDVVHVNGAYQFKGLLAAHREKVPIIWHMNDMYQPKSIRIAFRLFSRYANYFIFASERTKQYYESIAPKIRTKKSIVISAPVDTKKYNPKEGQGRPRNKPFDIATVGYINQHKGVEYLIEAAKSLEGKGIRLHIVGPVLDSQMRYGNRLKNESKALPHVIWHGFKKDTSNFLKDMDLYVCSSIREASPMSVWEAMATGLPVVSTDVGDVARIVEKYKCGKIVCTHDGQALAKSIKSIINEGPEALKLKGEQSRKGAEENMSLEVVCDQYLRFLEEIVSE